ncbi:MAG TPA: cytochrome c peroxidase [Acidobacteriaceae bacterium]|nr:cytochrome c peroxidase [Acidobacteriaceae bacterium]
MRTFLMLGVLVSAGTLCVTESMRVSAAPAKTHSLSTAAALGKEIFSDPTLSASGKMACSTCHIPRYAYGPASAAAVQYGGPTLKSPGYRAVPSLRYILNYVPVWSHARDTNPIEQLTETDTSPAGGYTWDGRFNSLHAQALLPFLSPVEMDNRNVTELAKKLSQARYAGAFRAVFGKDIFNHPELAVEKATLAIEQFELQDKSFHPYTSKVDRWLDGKATLTPQELRGKQLFDDPNGGNCASCHIDELGANGAHPLFTDFQFEALGVPRNNEIPWNANPRYYDMGLCGPFRKDAASKDPANCGLFRTPTLRNVAIRRVFFHNGRFHSLREALRFYVQRDTNPAKWYPVGAGGKVEKFNDLPARYRKNVDTTDTPLNRTTGQKPVWSEQDIDDVIAFLKALVDQDEVEKEDGTSTLPARASLQMPNQGLCRTDPRCSTLGVRGVCHNDSIAALRLGAIESLIGRAH